MRDPYALLQDADHGARLPRHWGLHMAPYCIDCDWPVKLVGEVEGFRKNQTRIVYVPRHGDHFARQVTCPKATWVTNGPRTSSTKRHIEKCPVADRRGTKLVDGPLHTVYHLPVCKTCAELLGSVAEQGEDDD